MGKGKPSRIGVLELQHIKNRDVGWCQTEHDRKMKKSATHAAYIMGRPAGYLCKTCTTEWKQLWESVVDYED